MITVLFLELMSLSRGGGHLCMNCMADVNFFEILLSHLVGHFPNQFPCHCLCSLSLTSFAVLFLFSLARFGYNNFIFSSISGGNCSRTLYLFPANALGAAILMYSLPLYFFFSNLATIGRGYVWSHPFESPRSVHSVESNVKANMHFSPQKMYESRFTIFVLSPVKI